jgi:glycosyltransferase involved in cell wall biosynthesis
MQDSAANTEAKRTRILLLIPHLGGGGCEHVMALLARGLSRDRYEVHLGLVTAADAGGTSLPPWVSVHALNAGRARAAALPLLRLVWQLRPDVILSGAAEVSFLALLLLPFLPSKARVLVRQNGTVSSLLASGGVPRLTRWLYRLLYWRANRVVCQSSAMAEDMVQQLGLNDEQIAVLPNPVDLPEIRAAMKGPSARRGSGPHLLAVGRLAHEKGFDLLLEALAVVRERFPGSDLIIAGSGREEAALKALCRSLWLESSVSFVGHVDRFYAFFPGTTLFVLSSRYEGMPNALLAAAAAGLPLVATPASGGVVDLLRGRRGAWLTPEITSEALARTIVSTLESIQAGELFSDVFLRGPSDLAAAAAGRNEEAVGQTTD